MDRRTDVFPRSSTIGTDETAKQPDSDNTVSAAPADAYEATPVLEPDEDTRVISDAGEEPAPPVNKNNGTVQRGSPSPSPPFFVEAVVDSRVDLETRETFYRVKWQGYSAKHNTWEPAKNLSNATQHLDIFYAKREKKGIYDISKIVDAKVDDKTGKTSYLVEWEGYPGKDTWEPERNLRGAPDLVAAYHKRNDKVDEEDVRTPSPKPKKTKIKDRMLG